MCKCFNFCFFMICNQNVVRVIANLHIIFSRSDIAKECKKIHKKLLIISVFSIANNIYLVDKINLFHLFDIIARGTNSFVCSGVYWAEKMVLIVLWQNLQWMCNEMFDLVKRWRFDSNWVAEMRWKKNVQLYYSASKLSVNGNTFLP